MKHYQQEMTNYNIWIQNRKTSMKYHAVRNVETVAQATSHVNGQHIKTYAMLVG